MFKASAKIKIYITLVIWLVLVGACFGYFFDLLDSSNRALLLNIQNQKTEQLTLQAEQDSFQKATQDLELLKSKQYQPDNLFNDDTSLVNEIKTLEELSHELNVTYTLNGLSGTINSAPKAKTQSPLYIVPYNISVSGQYENAVAFVKALENLSFITNVSSLAINGASNNGANISLTANFYLKQ